jgi:hypothetical protein
MTSVEITLDIAGPRPAPGVAPPLLPQPPATPPAPGSANDKWFGGRLINVQDSNGSQDRALLIVRQVQPAAFNGELTLRQVVVDSSANTIGNLDNKAQLFDNEIPGTRQTPPVAETAKNNPHEFNASSIPAAGLELWVEGRNASAAARDTGFQLGIKDVENDGDHVAMTVAVAPVIDLASAIVVVRLTYTNPARQRVTLRTSGAFTQTGTLTRSSDAIRFFDAATGGNEINFNGTDNVFTGAQLTAGVELFAQGERASAALDDVQLTLMLAIGGAPVAAPATATMTAVALTLDITQSRPAPGVDPPPLPQPPATAPAPGTANDKWFGGRFLAVQDSNSSQERALLIVRQVQPTVFSGTLLLRQVVVDSSANTIGNLDSKAQVFDDEIPGPRQTPPIAETAKNNPHEFNTSTIPASGLEFWVEGRNASTSVRDTGFQLGIKDIENDGDRVSLTVGTFKLRTQGAVQVGDRSSKIFATTQAAGQNVTVIADIAPALSAAQASLVTWTGGTSTANPLQRTVSRGTAAQTPISATFAGSTIAIEILVLADPSTPGSFSVGRLEYTETEEGDFTLPVPGAPAGVTFTVRRRAIVRYPADTTGTNVPVSTNQTNYPLVIILHGNHRRFLPSPPNPPGTFVESYRGFDYLASHLASHGYITLSIDVDDINARPGSTFIEARGEAILEHINIMVRRNTSFNPPTDRVDFTSKIDLSFIGLIGHSRGGEGVVSAQQLNISRGLGHQIKGMISIAPTNFEDFVHNSTPYLVIYGSADGDVRGSDDVVNPFLLYDRASAPKSLIFIYGAIHNRFSTNADWLDPSQIDNDDSRMISPADHQNIAKGYCLAFFDRNLRSQQQGFDIFFNNYERPASVTATVAIHHSYQDPTTQVIDNFEQPAPAGVNRALTNTLGQAVSGSGLANPTGSPNALTEALLRRAVTTFFVHDSFGAMIAWSSTGATYTTNLGTIDASMVQVLSFRVTQRLGSARNPAGTLQDFLVRLTDTSSESASIRVGTVTDIPFPYERHDHLAVHPPPPGPPSRFVDALPDERAFSKSALKTIRLKLDDFVVNNPRIDLSVLQRITFEFSQTASGEIAVDDIEFSL